MSAGPGTPPVTLTIAGSDSGGGAGIQADLKAFAAMRAYGTSAITAITAQNTRGVVDVHPLPATVVGAQIDAVLDDMAVAAVKVGMLGGADVAAEVAARARDGQLPNLVLDPVLYATSGHRLGALAVIERVLPYALLATPNRDEASALTGTSVTTTAEMAAAARAIAAGGARYVVVTGGEEDGDAVDVLWAGDDVRHLRSPWVPTDNDHGTGCTFSAAVAARLAHGDDLFTALETAKRYVTAALTGARSWKVGGGRGPLDHFG
ncbi:bifunctional hydroxymethylpyrimidine kinase/phosphomethylpyrimidine kinase [Catenuloplanes atrovinosus]|uniref:Hydroxymethylpyrimidine kinase/phosphomethylpyrimidine kinase n=1 Tax=Catenuloplanes atrovinosus TaxID=137266 RepID=A0AAE4CCN5_9ACTN|nr:bifunctional hydroxymethylpyrimidine kinase/phosphomethylpyrimidine kinase [Catenuloplanes atrovinosus]MDR7279432.1 hydroxymethylpyrimidine kinase/phosphomethylpyrimidine kinase [Catenuloplanes atrovinosus]